MNEKPRLTQNLISLAGMILAAAAFIVGVTLIIIDIRNHFDNPYAGIFTYMVIPAILLGGFLLILTGALIERKRRLRGMQEASKMPIINLTDKRQLRNFMITVIVTLLFICISVVGGYRTYHFTESVEFCGKTCHSVMKPEYVAYQNSPHANAGCTKCHIGPGADFFVKAKVNGLYQVYSTMFNKYNRPIPAPVHNLRPARDICESCHWSRSTAPMRGTSTMRSMRNRQATGGGSLWPSPMYRTTCVAMTQLIAKVASAARPCTFRIGWSRCCPNPSVTGCVP